jgi:energy-coupling factor transporter ATP-binding protein EcfA2
MFIKNLGCIGSDGLEVALDNIVCIVGRNNAGKSTVLRAYELAQGSKSIETDDCCRFEQGLWPEIELDVHIPEGIGNIAEKWKFDYKGYRIVRSRWVWTEIKLPPTRQTWDPGTDGHTGERAADGKAGGVDGVFKSRLPQPLRIDSLQDASEEHNQLMKLITEPVAEDLKGLLSSLDSDLKKALDMFVDEALKLVQKYKDEIQQTTTSIMKNLNGIFPNMQLSIDVNMPAPTIDPLKSLVGGSSIRIIDDGIETGIKQQGTGTRRALFWSILQVRNAILRDRKAQEKITKSREKLLNEIKKEEAKAKLKQDVIESLNNQLNALDQPSNVDDVALPGYILLIDEPENALHPMAIRAAQEQLYALARDPSWQVMLTTHSPYFVNPLEDHTTIIRIERDKKESTPRTFRAETTTFSPIDKQNLKALLAMDSSFCELFFGSYPILVEGDTEYAAFIASILEENDPLSDKIIIVRARGKALLEPLVRMLTHFGVSFGIVHDTDSPFRVDGVNNGVWAENRKIEAAIASARQQGIIVRHRISLPDFERQTGGVQESKDKPINMYTRLRADPALRTLVSGLFRDLYEGDYQGPFSPDIMENYSSAMEAISDKVNAWAQINAPSDVRFFGKSEEGVIDTDQQLQNEQL